MDYKTIIPRIIKIRINSLIGLDRRLKIDVYLHLNFDLPSGIDQHRQAAIPGLPGAFRYRFTAMDDTHDPARLHIFTFRIQEHPNEGHLVVLQVEHTIRLA